MRKGRGAPAPGAPRHPAHQPKRPTRPVGPQRPTGPGSPTIGPGTEASRSFFSPIAGGRAISLWGSSSMASEGAAEGTPLPISLHGHIAMANAPAVVFPLGLSATQSTHQLLQRGLLTPMATPTSAPDPATGAVGVDLHDAPAAVGPFRCSGLLGSVAGVLDGSTGTWQFIPDDLKATISEGVFSSTVATMVEGSRHVLWMGKNNILNTEQVLDHVEAMCQATDDPARDAMVLGHWATIHDAKGSSTANAMETVNGELAERYGKYYVDIAQVLTTEEGLSSGALAPLQLLEQASTHEALDKSVVPPLLVAADHIHLNGWGNLAVGAAVITRMRELGWL